MDNNSKDFFPQTMGLLFSITLIVTLSAIFLFNFTPYSKNEVVRVGERLAVVKSSKLTRVYTLVTIDAKGNTVSETKEIENNIREYRMGE